MSINMDPATKHEDNINNTPLLDVKNEHNTNPKENVKVINFPDLEKQAKNEVTEDGHSTGAKHPTTYFESLFHLIKANIGSGVFAMGDAFKNSGLLLGPILTIFLGAFCVYGNHILIKCSKELGKRRKLAAYPTFPDTMAWAFESGPKGFQKYSTTIRFLVQLFNAIAQLGFSSVYFVFISSTLKTVLASYGYVMNVHVLMAIIFIPMVATAMVRSLKYLVPFSVIANILIGVGICLTMYISMQDLPSISSRIAFGSLSRIPLFFGTVIYCFEGIGLVLPLQSDMKKPDQFGSAFGVLNVGMAVVGGIMIWIGFVGYLKYGDSVAGSLTLNLPDNSLFSEIIQIAIAIGILFTYALQFHVAVTFVWPDVNRKYGPFKNPVLAEMGVRFVLAIVTFVAAEIVPQLSLFISLLGSVTSNALALVFPPLCDLALHWGRQPAPHYIFDTASLILAVFGFVTGVYYSLTDIIAAFFYT